MFLTVAELIGRFHPVLVHLPIGILVIACLFQWVVMRDRFSSLKPAIPVLFFWGMIGAALSCITGLLLSQSGDYGAQLLSQHQWMGISTAILSLLLFGVYKVLAAAMARVVSLILLVMITITGHLGGSLTHGAGFLTEGFSTSGENSKARAPIANIQEAVVYTDLVQPLLQAHCYSCHGAQKQKGKLALHEPALILKGGEDAKAVVPGNPDQSELIRRILLPVENKDHMAPKEKPQLSVNDIALLQWWIKAGADFGKKVKDLPQDEKIKPVLASFQTGEAAGNATTTVQQADVPTETVKAADTSDIAKLMRAGVMVMPVARNSNYLSINFVTATADADSLLPLLRPLQKQVIWLKLDHAVITDASLEHLLSLKQLTRLQLSNTAIGDQGLSKLAGLQQLHSLNLVGTAVTAKGLQALQPLKKLLHLYLYHTAVTGADWQQLEKGFPQTKLDSGNYSIPFMAIDTMKVTKLEEEK